MESAARGMVTTPRRDSVLVPLVTLRLHFSFGLGAALAPPDLARLAHAPLKEARAAASGPVRA